LVLRLTVSKIFLPEWLVEKLICDAKLVLLEHHLMCLCRLTLGSFLMLGALGLLGMTIQRISRAAGVPMASVYHFFPTATAVAVAIAQSYFEGFP
jgi:hypothetical protein